ncbi:MAG: M23 family metallopeptidase [Oscillospiraceae bacterium]|nr:M23 family metallopeptidase [Oscillospiraceae bacterium]
MAISFFVTYSTSLPVTYATEYSESETWSIETDVDISEDIIGEVVTVESDAINAANSPEIVWTIPSGSAMVLDEKYFMSEGDTVNFNLSYTLASVSIRVGMYSATSGYEYKVASNGIFTETLTIDKAGVKYLRILNTSSTDVQVIGTYTVNTTSPFVYMFKSPYYASYLSSLYGESRSGGNHYAIDITTGVPGQIKGYPVYNTCEGTVIFANVFSDEETTCVAVKHSNGFTSRFLHMDISSSISSKMELDPGELIGTVSDNGSTNAYHLHYDLNTLNNYYGTFNTSNTIDPTYVFPDVTFTSS